MNSIALYIRIHAKDDFTICSKVLQLDDTLADLTFHLLAGRIFNLLALACLCATLVAIDGPLLQRASIARSKVSASKSGSIHHRGVISAANAQSAMQLTQTAKFKRPFPRLEKKV